jgi:hypothetical protein
MRRLLARHEAQSLDPAHVELGAMPVGATMDMLRVAENMRLLMGLRLAVGQDEPLPYAAAFAAELLGWDDKRRASRAIRKLCDAGVVVCVGELPPVRGRYGTKLYLPGLGAGAADEGHAVLLEGAGDVAAEPVVEVRDEPLMELAVQVAGPVEGARSQLGLRERVPVEGLVASGDSADVEHATDGIGEPGGDDDDVARAERLAERHGWGSEL